MFRIALALWLGGLVWQMAGVQALFAADRPIAVVAAPILFHRFESYQIAVGIAAVMLAAILLRSTRLLLALILVALILAIVSCLAITPRIDAMREAGLGSSPEFRRWHGASMLLYCAEAVLLTVSFLVGPKRMR